MTSVPIDGYFIDPEKVDGAAELLDESDSEVECTAFDWLLSGKIGLDDIKIRMSNELTSVTETIPPDANMETFVAKWEPLISELAQSLYEYATYSPSQVEQLNSYQSSNTLLDGAITQHISTAKDQPDEPLFIGLQRRLFDVFSGQVPDKTAYRTIQERLKISMDATIDELMRASEMLYKDEQASAPSTKEIIDESTTLIDGVNAEPDALIELLKQGTIGIDSIVRTMTKEFNAMDKYSQLSADAFADKWYPFIAKASIILNNEYPVEEEFKDGNSLDLNMLPVLLSNAIMLKTTKSVQNADIQNPDTARSEDLITNIMFFNIFTGSKTFMNEAGDEILTTLSSAIEHTSKPSQSIDPEHSHTNTTTQKDPTLH